MTKQPEPSMTAEAILLAYGKWIGGFNKNEHPDYVKDHSEALDELKRAMDAIIGEDQPPLVDADGRRVQAENRIRRYANWTREQQRQRLDQWLGEAAK